jgi:hypothetical protein
MLPALRHVSTVHVHHTETLFEDVVSTTIRCNFSAISSRFESHHTHVVAGLIALAAA